MGVCKHCQRGICTECATLVDDTLACKGRHEAEVHAANQLFHSSVVQSQRVGSGFVRNATFYGLVGALFAGFGWLQYRYLGAQALFFILIGVFLLYAAAANFLESRKYR